jgi:hypothetical protein
MKANTCLTSTCSNCQFFRPEGHHRGSCAQLHTMVNAGWPSCSLGAPAFGSVLDELLEQLKVHLRDTMHEAPERA